MVFGSGVFFGTFLLPPILLLPLTVRVGGSRQLPQLPRGVGSSAHRPHARPSLRRSPSGRLLKRPIPQPHADPQMGTGSGEGAWEPGICVFTHFPEPPFGGHTGQGPGAQKTWVWLLVFPLTGPAAPPGQ